MPSDSPLEFFIDRSLGRHIVPEAARAAGAVVHMMADVYGERIGQGLADAEWLRDAGDSGWVVLMKITRIATNGPGPYIYGVYADGVRALWPK